MFASPLVTSGKPHFGLSCYDSFEFLVMPMGLTNVPATFQHFMNDIFQDMSDVFMVVYLDDILVYSESEHVHRDHVQQVLTCLRENNLHVKPEKSLFHTNAIEFLGFMVSLQGITMDSAKTEAISRWPTPSNVKQIHLFVRFTNFYHCFIVNFSETVAPLTHLTRKDAKFSWGPEHQQVFETLKLACTQAPVLTHFNPENPIVVETDTSDYAITAFISQISPDDGDLHPIAFYSCGMKPPELNYEIYDKELLAIFEAFWQWRNYLEGLTHAVLVLSDHKNLKYFVTTKQLTHRQVRWSAYLSGFNYLIRYCAGHLGTKPDALT